LGDAFDERISLAVNLRDYLLGWRRNRCAGAILRRRRVGCCGLPAGGFFRHYPFAFSRCFYFLGRHTFNYRLLYCSEFFPRDLLAATAFLRIASGVTSSFDPVASVPTAGLIRNLERSFALEVSSKTLEGAAYFLGKL
jgi:hypothetical protein